MKFKIVEKFISINGEGELVGKLAVFIRFAGCNLSCSYCDTKWANHPKANFEYLDENEIYSYIKSTKIDNVTLTGGEPLIQDGLSSLLSVLCKDELLNVEIETNGSVHIKPFKGMYPKEPSFTIDYKLYSSSMETNMVLDNYNYISSRDTVKFVIGDKSDLNNARMLIDTYDLINKCNVHFSSIFGTIQLSEIVDYMKSYKLKGVRLQPQLHKIIWSPDSRGV